ncbi:hypothetical protein Tco_0376128 [Tanacetum coccineum]
MKQLMTADFCPIEEIQRMEHELWNLKIKECDIVAYTQSKGEVTSSKPVDLNEAVRMAHKLMKQKSQARNERILEGKKRKWENLQGGNSSGKGNITPCVLGSYTMSINSQVIFSIVRICF